MQSTIPVLSTRLFGLRFADPLTEHRYHEWRIATGMPFARLGYLGSMPSWGLLLAAIYVLEPESIPQAGPAIIGWIVLLVILTLLTHWYAARAAVMGLAAAANCLAGFLIAWLLYEAVGSTLDSSVRAGLMTGGVLIVMYFGFTIFRIPPGWAVAGITPYVVFSMSYLHSDFREGDLTLLEAGAFAACQLIAYGGGLLVCLVIEGATRRSFIKDEIILSQQQDLQKSRDAIRRYVPPSVARHIIEGHETNITEPQRRRVTVLFADIVGFTEIADRLEAEVMTEVLNDYMSAMSDLIEQHGGTLNEFAGDGLMALFGAPDVLAPEVQAGNAIKAAQAMQAKMPELNNRWRKLGLGAELQTRIGINTGMVSVGSYGSQGRMTYTAIGLHTNIASRIESAAKPAEILISDATYQLSKDAIACEPRGEIECKGVHFPVQVYSPS